MDAGHTFCQQAAAALTPSQAAQYDVFQTLLSSIIKLSNVILKASTWQFAGSAV